MADHLLKRLYNAAVNKGQQTHSLTEHDHGFLSLLGGTLSYLFTGRSGRNSFNEFLDAYATNPIVSMVVSKISFASASIKRIVVDDKGNEITNSKLLELMENPNSEQGMVEFYEEIDEYLSLTGNVFVRFVTGIGGFGEELIILAPNRVDIICNNLGIIIRYDFTDYDNRLFKYDPEEILHIKTNNVVDQDHVDRKFGLSPLRAARPIIQSSNEKFSAEASIFKNRGIIGFASNDSDIPMHEEERLEAQKVFTQNSGGSDKFNSIYVTNTRLKFVQTGMSPTDLKLLEGIISSLRQLCAMYGMPSVLFNDNESSTFNNVLEAKTTAYTDVYIPLANKVDKSLSPWLSKKLNVNENLKADLTSIEILKSSTNDVAQALNSLEKEARTRVLENMTQEEIRALASLGILPEGSEVIGSGKPEVNEPTQA